MLTSKARLVGTQLTITWNDLSLLLLLTSKHTLYRCKQWQGLPSSSMATMQRMGTCSAPALLSRTDQASGGSGGYVGVSLLMGRGVGGGGGSRVLACMSCHQSCSEPKHLCLNAQCMSPEWSIAALQHWQVLTPSQSIMLVTSLMQTFLSLPHCACGVSLLHVTLHLESYCCRVLLTAVSIWGCI